MRFRFRENMYGKYESLEPARGSGYFDFTCTAEACLREFARSRLATIKGTATMEGVVAEAPLDGTVYIDPLFSKKLVYDFTFRQGNELYRFLGEKTVRFTSPVSSMTLLIGTVEKGGLPFASVESHFRLKELPAFLLSFRLFP